MGISKHAKKMSKQEDLDEREIYWDKRCKESDDREVENEKKKKVGRKSKTSHNKL